MKVTAIFDIGKTNKKFFLFDKKFRKVHEEYISIKETKDEDGFPCDDLDKIAKWIKSVLKKHLKENRYQIDTLNFSTYGASFVHLDKNGKPLTPVYNYLKPYPKKILNSFYKKYGTPLKIASATASPPLGMLNSGLQLYWLINTRPGLFKKIKWSLHLPQYLSYLLTGTAVCEPTSIGCHTALWDYKKGDYHDWVHAEKIAKKLPPLFLTNHFIKKKIKGRKIKIGIGIHDSSAALLPYFLKNKKPFLLISTGTWSISLNPFNRELLTKADLQNDCLNYQRIDGLPVKAARLFLGNEHDRQSIKLLKHYGQSERVLRKIKFDRNCYEQLKKDGKLRFHFTTLPPRKGQPKKNRIGQLPSFKLAYHQLMMELVELQVIAAKRAIGQTNIKRIYVDGGFAKNDLFIKLLSISFKDVNLHPTNEPYGTAIGAALVINESNHYG